MARKKLAAAALVSGVQGSVLRIVRTALEKYKVTTRVNKAAGLIRFDCLLYPQQDAPLDNGNGQARVNVVIDFSVPGHVLIVAPWVWDVGVSPHKQAILDALRPLQDRLGVVRLGYRNRHGCVMPHVSLPADCVAANPSIISLVISDLLTAVHQVHPVICALLQSGKVDMDAFTFSVPWCAGATQHVAGERDSLVRFNERHARLLSRFAAIVSPRPKALPRALVGMLVDHQVVIFSPQRDPLSLKKFREELDACCKWFVIPMTRRALNVYRGTVVWCRDKKFRGVSTGGRRSCACGAADRVFVRWDDGDHSWPCIKALEQIGPNEFKYR
jgi:hypothetical protein